MLILSLVTLEIELLIFNFSIGAETISNTDRITAFLVSIKKTGYDVAPVYLLSKII